ncbi:hypothetical protein [Canibacter oris]|uniref:3D domain-containing protein n=1 Tax=Canibacter oris TaxID=1365628 RepID=A0A840DHB6_9MICO|nr:hypothetical protein [Canibacter oris]MBB4070862.1 hypothetical protein [Canibacter oris]
MRQQYKSAGADIQSTAVTQLVPHHFSAFEGHTFKFQGTGTLHRMRGTVAVTAAIILAATSSFASTTPQTLATPYAPHNAAQTLEIQGHSLLTARLDRLHEATALELEKKAAAAPAPAQFSLDDLMFRGVINWGGYKFTYYSQQVLPGGGLQIPGRHVSDAGFVSDGAGFIVLAGDAPLGTVFDTPFGAQGKIYDRGTVGNHLDVYTR